MIVIRHKSHQKLFPARLNRALEVGTGHDPLLEIRNGQGWVRLGPVEANDQFEIVYADRPAMEQLAMLTEYGLAYAPDFELWKTRATAV